MAATRTMNTSQAMVESLLAHGVDTVFGIPGAHTYDFSEAVYGQRERLRYVHTRHEQGAAYMAYGYAKSSGRAGVFSVVPGPGVLNAGATLCTAYGANAPVMCLTGNIMSHLIGQGRGQLHELPDQLATLRGLTKWSQRIEHPSAASATMSEAFRQMLSGRQRPVAVEVPWDVFGMVGEVEAPEVLEPRRPAVDGAAIERAAALIATAKRPLIMVGGGAVGAPEQVLALAQRLQAPVTSHRSGKGIVPDDNTYAFNLVAAYEHWRECDLLIGIGSRLELQFMRWRWQPAGLKVVRIDIDPTEMVRLKPDVGIVADAAEGTAALVAALTGPQRVSRAKEFEARKAAARERVATVQPQMGYLDAIRAALPRDGFFVEEVSQMGFTGRFGFPVYGPRQYVTCGYQDNLGFGFNTALGVKVANPDKPVVSVSGDGGFLFGVQELATAAQHGLNVVAVVFNNQAYGNVRRDQSTVYGGHLIGADLLNPDFVALARSFGIPAERVITPADLQRAIESALRERSPALIEVPVPTGSEVSPWPFLHPVPHG
jgi:acetolactate synthase-1/2/3 large subunit